jgi:uncharacterized protein with HEPN domain
MIAAVENNPTFDFDDKRFSERHKKKDAIMRNIHVIARTERIVPTKGIRSFGLRFVLAVKFGIADQSP